MRLQPDWIGVARWLYRCVLVPGCAILLCSGCTQQTVGEFVQSEMANFVNGVIMQYASQLVNALFGLA